MSSQESLFSFEPTGRADRLDSETVTNVSEMRDKHLERRLGTLVGKLEKTDGALNRALLATEMRDLAEALIASSLRDANLAGVTWRQIGAALGIPFQTLYGRYGRET